MALLAVPHRGADLVDLNTIGTQLADDALAGQRGLLADVGAIAEAGVLDEAAVSAHEHIDPARPGARAD